VYRVGEIVIDVSCYEIRRGDERVHVEPQVFEVVRLLIGNADRVVSKDELLDTVWGTKFVSESALTSRIKAARRALADDGRRQWAIKTVHGRGYRWVAPFEVEEATPGAAASAGDDAVRTSAPRPIGRGLPTPLTPFVGRQREVPSLVEAIEQHRLVTATGPGGVGKTRLAIAAAMIAGDRRADGVAFVDLVEVSEPAMVVDAIATSVGVVERAQDDARAALHAALADRDCLLVIDNCEHLVDAVRTAVEELLRACADVRVLATSRIRLMAPYEHVFAVPGLSIGDDGEDAHRDAIRLFVARMTDAGERPSDDPQTLETITTICRSVDGMALAIELAAARAPSIGLDGLSQALGTELPLLSVGGADDHRHRSLRTAIDWTYRLLDPEERATLRAAAVFAAPFEVGAVADVLGRPVPAVLDPLARLVDWNLMTRRVDTTSRFRVLETIRQFGLEQADSEGEEERLRRSHLDWVRRRLEEHLGRPARDEAWCDEADRILPDGRAALRWAAARAAERPAGRVAELLGHVTFQRGRPGEAQARYEEAAEWATTAAERHEMLRAAGGVAAARNVGGDTLLRFEAAAAVALADGRPDDAAVDLASAAIYRNRASGIISHPVDEEGTQELIARARALATGEPRAVATIAMAENWSPEAAFRTRAGAARALELARELGDPLLESTALDLWTVVELDDRDLAGATAAIAARLALLEPIPIEASSGFEFFDAHQMACRVQVARGEFTAARAHADALARLPFVREERHLAMGRRMEVDALAGEFDDALRASELFRRDWILSGRPKASNLAPCCYSISMAHGLLGDDDGRAAWIDLTRSLFNPGNLALLEEAGWAPVLDAFVDLDRGEVDRALVRLDHDPDDDTPWRNPNRRLWRPWHAAAWAEASVLAAVPEAADRVERAAGETYASLLAEALVERARSVLRGDADAVIALVGRFEQIGARYQAARTRSLAAAM